LPGPVGPGPAALRGVDVGQPDAHLCALPIEQREGVAVGDGHDAPQDLLGGRRRSEGDEEREEEHAGEAPDRAACERLDHGVLDGTSERTLIPSPAEGDSRVGFPEAGQI
jgi:hypothetical protein